MLTMPYTVKKETTPTFAYSMIFCSNYVWDSQNMDSRADERGVEGKASWIYQRFLKQEPDWKQECVQAVGSHVKDSLSVCLCLARGHVNDTRLKISSQRERVRMQRWKALLWIRLQTLDVV